MDHTLQLGVTISPLLHFCIDTIADGVRRGSLPPAVQDLIWKAAEDPSKTSTIDSRGVMVMEPSQIMLDACAAIATLDI